MRGAVFVNPISLLCCPARLSGLGRWGGLGGDGRRSAFLPRADVLAAWPLHASKPMWVSSTAYIHINVHAMLADLAVKSRQNDVVLFCVMWNQRSSSHHIAGRARALAP
jgi:hypothetical protein